MKTILLLILTVFCLELNAQSAKDFIAEHMLAGNIHVLSSYKDTAAIDGFATSDIRPMQVSFNTFNQKGFFLFIDTTSQVTFKQKYNGFNFFIVNKSDSTIKFSAIDSKLNILAEAYVLNEWQAIEYLPQSFCGNSFHKIFLKRNHYWKYRFQNTAESYMY